MTPLDAMLRILREEGVRHVFGNPGTTELPFLDSLADTEDIEYVLGVQEASVVAMADGYARTTRKPAFVSLHAAGGLTNGLVGLLNASRSHTPLVVTAGQQDRRHLAQDPMLSGDLVGLASPAVKTAMDVHHVHDLPVLLRRAFAFAAQPPAGPVFLSIPMDVLTEDVHVAVPGMSTVPPLGPATGVAEAAEVLRRARCPAIVAGDGVGRDRAMDELIAVAEALGAATYHQPMHDGLNFPQTHALHAGTLAPVNAAIRNSLDSYDVIFVVGCHAFMAHHYTPGPAIPDSATVVQLDTDPAEIGRNFAVRVGLVGGLAETLAELVRTLTGSVPEAGSRARALAQHHTARRAAAETDALRKHGQTPLDPKTAAHTVATALPADCVVVEEAITMGVELRTFLRLDRPGSLVHTVGGGLGSGIGAAVGSRMGDPRRPVVSVLGDGCTLFGVQGLWSAARYQVPVTFVVMNNGEYRTLKETLDAWNSAATANGRYPGLDLAPPRLDFTQAAAFFGVDSVRVGSTGELIELVATAGTRDAPLVVEVPITGHSIATQRREVDTS